MKKKSVLSKLVTPNLQNLPLTEYYKSLPNSKHVPKGSLTPKLILLHAISEQTGKSVLSIRKWVSGRIIPPPMERNAIADLLKSDEDTLFPQLQAASV